MGIVIALVVIGVGALALFLFVPRPADPVDGPLPRDVETRLLLGEDPEGADPADEPERDPRRPDPA